MGDLIEKYLTDRRQEFDDLEPTDKLWEGIRGELHQPKKDFGWIWKVAAVIFLVSTIALVVERQLSSASNSDEIVAQSEFDQAETYYFHLINEKKKELGQLDVEKKNYDLLLEEQKLDEYYQALKKQYMVKTNNDKVKDAMIENLRIRIRILNDQIRVLNESKKSEKNDKNIQI